jgi:hypothetical protein
MRCPEEPQLEQGDGHEQDGDADDMAPALYQQLKVESQILPSNTPFVCSARPEPLCSIMNPYERARLSVRRSPDFAHKVVFDDRLSLI